jgi:uncharacterized repeat protein (TIGR02543 family)
MTGKSVECYSIWFESGLACIIQQTRRVCKMERLFTRMAKLGRALALFFAAALMVLPAACSNPSGSEDPKQYTITFNSHEGAAVPAITADEGTAVNEPTAPTRDGYDFTGWFSAASGGTAYTWPHTLNADITMHAQWRDATPIQYTISFESHGGSEVGAVTEDAGTAVEKPGDPTWDGYSFEGWFSGETGGTMYSWPYALNGDVTMHAQWRDDTLPEPEQYTIVFNSYGGTEAGTIKANKETAVNKPADPTRDGYDFEGWFSAETGGTEYEWPHILTGDVTMHARWTAVSYAITYHLDDGTNAPENPAEYTIEDTITLAAPVRVGHSFGGWFENSNFAGEAVTTITAGSSGSKTFYARWTVVTYTVAYDKNAADATGTMDSGTHTYGESQALISNGFVRTGHTFIRWTAQADGGGDRYTDGQSVSNLASTAGAIVTLYAQWSVNYAIEYVLNGANDNEGNPAYYTAESLPLALAPPVRTGYIGGNWHDNPDIAGAAVTTIPAGETGNKTFYAGGWTPVNYSITYHLDGGTNAPENPAEYTIEDAIALGIPVRDGYIFSGWFDDGNFTGPAITTIAAGSSGEKTFYAKWRINAGVNISLWVNEEDGNILASHANITISKAGSDDYADSFTAEVASVYTDVQWHLFGDPVSAAQTLVIRAADYPVGSYSLGVTVTKDNVPYSTEIHFTVTD